LIKFLSVNFFILKRMFLLLR